jgi:hypothetical protein
MLGDTNVGKTSLVLRFAEGYYRESSRSPTVGAFFITKRVQTDAGITCKVQIWDTAGQSQFRKMAPMYYKTAAAAVLCYDVSNMNSFDCVKQWLDELSPVIKGEQYVQVLSFYVLIKMPYAVSLVLRGRLHSFHPKLTRKYSDSILYFFKITQRETLSLQLQQQKMI